MKKTTLKKKNKQKIFTPRVLGFVILAILLGVMLFLQLWFNNHLLSRIQVLEEAKIEKLITDNLRTLNEDPVVEPLSGKVYLPGPRLVLPAYPKELLGGIQYYYNPVIPDGNDQEILHITSEFALNYGIAGMRSAEGHNGIFEAVPTAQACTRQIIVQFETGTEPELPDYSSVGTRRLADGRTLELFTADQCDQNAELLVKYVEQIQSY